MSNLSLDKFKILLVEDNVMNQILISYNFKKLGCIISIANNGNEALELVKSNFFDFIIMDIMMPFMDGYQTTSSIRKIEISNGFKKSIIIGLTSGIYDSEKDKCISSGMNYFMSKPFDIDSFVSILRSEKII